MWKASILLWTDFWDSDSIPGHCNIQGKGYSFFETVGNLTMRWL